MDQEDYIIDYLDGTLKGEELSSFEKRLKADPEFAKEVEQYRVVHADMEIYRDYQRQKAEVEEVARSVEAELRGKREGELGLGGASDAEIGEQDQAGSGNRGKRRFRWWAIAASLVLLVTCTYFLLPKYGPSYFQEAYPGLIDNPGALRGESQDRQVFLDALGAYSGGDYASCVEILLATANDSPERILLGSAQLLTHHPVDAINTLQPVLADPDFLEYARWLQALSYLHNGEEDQAIELLQTMVDDPVRLYKRSEAGSILGKLRSFWR